MYQAIGHHLLFLLLEGLLLRSLCRGFCHLLSLGLAGRFLLVGHGSAARTLAGAGVGMGALAAHRQAAAMAQAAIRTHLDEALDVQREFLAKIAFHRSFIF